ncbi:hypothetical protein [Ornithinimicrobium cerasi]|uniref:Para-aminobenzoate synthetase n=1 Tax=Ornithinimicrobium cerasi TaxID=2248773 RepID=A0A285VMX2_9MICO|nr:hypothetical protein [Ornithinimicrobium cerasi]SOC54566.1 para-aminobenzoate synthetase [Ornithinimicrobium cerasi]
MPPDGEAQLAATVLDALARTCRRPVLVGLDGRSGSGKTELAERLRAGLVSRGRTVTAVHLDDLYPGWSGLAAGVGVLREHVLEPLRAGREAAYPSWDWTADAPGPRRPVEPAEVVVVEGVGALAGGCADLLDVRVWLEAPTDVRRSRALGRDGATTAPWWDMWAAQEDLVLAAGRPVADMVVDTTTVRVAGTD